MSFRESPRFPESVSFGAQGGPSYLTNVVELESGKEQRNQLWSAARARYNVVHDYKNPADFAALLAFFRATAIGKTHSFRFKDWSDYQATDAQGRVGTAAAGTGTAAYQLYKRYVSGAQYEDRLIAKPVSGQVSVYRASALVTVGAGAGQISIDYTTGIVTFVADASVAITSHTVGASHVFTTATNMAALSIGEKVYITGVTGTGATTLNSIAHTITNKVGTGPVTWTISTNTVGKTATTGTAAAYPQSGELLVWAGQFDVPCRFDVDHMNASLEVPEATSWQNIPIIEVRV